jgi:WD40 repeat protein
MRFQIPALDKVTIGTSLSVSPDGRTLAFSGRGADGQTLLWIRSFDTLAARALPGTEMVLDSVFWSPDGRSIGIAANGKLKKVEAAGGGVQTLCDLQGTFRGGAWAPDGTIIFGVTGRPLMRISEAGGLPTPLTTISRRKARPGR